MNLELIYPFVTATINVLKTMAKIDPVPGKPYIKKNNSSYGDITGVIGMSGDGIQGSFAVSFPKSSILNILSKMLGEHIDDLGADVNDGIGEITNIITGGAKAEFSKRGLSFGMAIPTVVSGKGHSIEHVTDEPVVAVSFETEAGPFFIEVSLSSR